jgi:peptidoglycan/LPS O-acetylase OafA/YrhL
MLRTGDGCVKRLECLDGLRGVLALYVLLVHMAPFAPLPWALLQVFSHGEAAVDLFFVLSGLVIAASVEHFDYRAGPFLIARAARIFPVFLPVFAVAVIVQPLSTGFASMPWIGPDSPAHQIWSDGWPETWALDLLAHLTMLHGIFPNILLPDIWISLLGAAWSLSTEWQFYALVAIIGARLGRGQRGLWRLTIVLLLIGTFAAIWHAGAPAEWQFSRAFLPNKAAYFALGVASIALLRNQEAWPRFAVVVAAALALCLARENSFKSVVPLIWVVCLAAQVARTRAGHAWPGFRTIGAMLDGPLPRWLGGISYSLYLVNEPVQKLLGIVLAAAVNGDVLLFSVLWIPTAVLLPLGAAWWLRTRIELPALRYGRAWAHAILQQDAIPAMLPGGIFGAAAPARSPLFAGMALPVPVMADHAGLALANTHMAHGFESLFAPEDHLATYAISPAPEQVLSRLIEQTRQIVLGSSVVVRLSRDPVQAARQQVRLQTLCGTHCPYRPNRPPPEGADDVADASALTHCAATPGECQQWLGQHGIIGQPGDRTEDATRQAKLISA